MREYKKVLRNIKAAGNVLPAARDNMPDRLFQPTQHINVSFLEGFPIITGKKMPFYSIVGELIAFMKGETDVRKFSKLGCDVWWDNAYKWNVKDKGKTTTMTEYKGGKLLSGIPINSNMYDLGRIYPAQWRDWFGMKHDKLHGYINNRVDQLTNMIDNMNNKPYSNYHVMNAWNPSEMNSDTVSQPNCHVYFQGTMLPINKDKNIKYILNNYLTSDTIYDLFTDLDYKPNNYLVTHLTQRSADMFLGVPFNITSYSLLTILLGIFTNSVPLTFDWIGVNSHIYSNHFKQVDEYLDRETYRLPKLRIKGIKSLRDIEDINTLDDVKKHFQLENYESGDRIKAPLSVGL